MPVTTYRLTQATLKQSTNPVIQHLVANHFYLDAKKSGVTIGRDMQRASLQLNVNGTVIDHTLDGLTAFFEDNNRLIKQKVLAISPDLKSAYEDTEKAYAQPCRSTIENAVGAIVKNPCPSVVHSVIDIEAKSKTNRIVSKVSKVTVAGMPQSMDCEGTMMIWSLVDVDDEAYRNIKVAEIAELEKKKNPSTPGTAGAIDRQIDRIKKQTNPQKIYQLTEICVTSPLLKEALMNDSWEQAQVNALLIVCDEYLAYCRSEIEVLLTNDYPDLYKQYLNNAGMEDGKFIIKSGFYCEKFVLDNPIFDDVKLNTIMQKYTSMANLKRTLVNADQPNSEKLKQFNMQFKSEKNTLEDSHDDKTTIALKCISFVLMATIVFSLPGYFLYQKLFKPKKDKQLTDSVEHLVSSPTISSC